MNQSNDQLLLAWKVISTLHLVTSMDLIAILTHLKVGFTFSAFIFYPDFGQSMSNEILVLIIFYSTFALSLISFLIFIFMFADGRTCRGD